MEGGGEAQPQLQAEVTKVAVTQGKQCGFTLVTSDGYQVSLTLVKARTLG